MYRAGTGTYTAYNTVISGNTATTADMDEVGVTSTSGYVNTTTGITCTTNCTPMLSSQPGTFGSTVVAGTTIGGTNTANLQVLLPLPGSPLLAAGNSTSADVNSATTDGRGAGFARTVSYNGTTYVDIGAAQTSYAESWSTQPPTGVAPATNFSAGLTFTEHGNALSFASPQTISLPVTLATNGSGTLTGSPLKTLSSTGTATGTFQVSAGATSNTLTAAADSYVSAASNNFLVDLGAVFIVNTGGSVASENNNGTNQSAATSGGGSGAAIDSLGNLWTINTDGNGVSMFNSSGGYVTSYSGGSISGASALAIDGNGNAWFANAGSLTALTNAGAAVFKNAVAQSAGISTPASLQIDTAGSVWIANPGNGTVTEVIGVAAPVVAPTVTAVTNNTLGTKP